MKTRTIKSMMIVAATCLLFVTCKKDKKDADPPDESGQATSDSREVQGENVNAINDINTVIMDDANLRGRVSGQGSSSSGTICGISIDTTGRSSGSITLNFDGTTCNNRSRTGQIKLALVNYAQGKRWKDQGAVLQVQYINYKITRASDQKSIQLNGTQTINNESGGTWWEFLILKSQASLVHSVTGSNLKVKFSDGKEATYNINRRVTYTLPNNILTVTAEGIGTSGGANNLENFGTTRNGETFTSQVTTPIVWNATCGAGAPLKGAINVQVSGKNFVLHCTFGTDANGNPVNVAANQCAYGWKLTWTANNKTKEKVIVYR